ncbi:MAG: AraC family transcriptional regulator [Oscillospiraceae bacterium]|nr:AraC family transcriptional regulator [Oscillospiraceae bacterium]
MKFFHQYHTSPQIIHNNKINFEPHLHEAVEIITLFKGETALSVDGRDYTLNAGDFLIIFPNTVHSFYCEGKVDVGKFIFSPTAVSELKTSFDSFRPKYPIIKGELAALKGLDSLARDILSTYSDSSSAVKSAYLFLLTAKLLELCELEKKQSADGAIVEQIFDYCQKNYKQKITQADVARALHISGSYLSHIFMYKLKINFCGYINILRVNEACSLLSKTQMSITEIADESGFSSLRSFNRAFIRHVGVAPKEYRKSL